MNKIRKQRIKTFIMRKYRENLLFILAIIFIALLPGCDLIAGIFEAGVWVGIIVSALVVFILIFIVIKIIKALGK
jgi:hypothetical protein